jgi:hypothetical protein
MGITGRLLVKVFRKNAYQQPSCVMSDNEIKQFSITKHRTKAVFCSVASD